MNLNYPITVAISEHERGMKLDLSFPDFPDVTASIVAADTSSVEEYARGLVMQEMRQLAMAAKPIPLPSKVDEENSPYSVLCSMATTLRIYLNNALVAKRKSFERAIGAGAMFIDHEDETLQQLYDFDAPFDLEELLTLFNTVPARVEILIKS